MSSASPRWTESYITQWDVWIGCKGVTLTHGSPPEKKDNAALMELSQTQSKTQFYCYCIVWVKQMIYVACLLSGTSRLETVLQTHVKSPSPKEWQFTRTLMFDFYSCLKSGIWLRVTSCDGLTMKSFVSFWVSVEEWISLIFKQQRKKSFFNSVLSVTFGVHHEPVLI